PIHLMRIIVLEPVDAAGCCCGPGTMGPHCFCVSSGVALMVVEVAERSGPAEGLFAIPHANVVNIGAGDDEKFCADGLIPVRRRAEFVVGDPREARRALTAAGGAAWIGERCAGNAGEGLAIMLGGAVEAERCGCVMRGFPVGSSCVAPETRSVLLERGTIVAG